MAAYNIIQWFGYTQNEWTKKNLVLLLNGFDYDSLIDDEDYLLLDMIKINIPVFYDGIDHKACSKQ